MDFRLYLPKRPNIAGLVTSLDRYLYLKEDAIKTIKAPCRDKGTEPCFVFDIKRKCCTDNYWTDSITPSVIASELEMEALDEVVIPNPESPEEPRYILAVKREDFYIREKLKKKLKFNGESYELRLSILMERLESFGSVASISRADYPIPDDITEGAVMVLLESKPPNERDLTQMIGKKLQSKHCISTEVKIRTPDLKRVR